MNARWRAPADEPLTIEVRGPAVHAHHGVHDHEREHGQRFLLDLALVPRSALGCETDRLGDTVSYGDAAAWPSRSPPRRAST